MAYVAGQNKTFAVVLDGKVGPAYDSIGQDTPIFSPNSKRMAYKAKKGSSWHMVVDGREQQGYEGLSTPLFSPNSTHMLYAGKKGAKYCLVVDGREIGCYEAIMKDGMKFSLNSERWAIVVMKNKKQIVVVDGKEGNPYDKIAPPTFSGDARRFAHTGNRNGKWMMVVNGKEGPAFQATGVYLFSPDSQHLYYAFKKDGKWGMMMDDKEGPAIYDGIGIPAFSPDGKRVSYLGMRGEKSVMISDGKEALSGIRSLSLSYTRILNALPTTPARESSISWVADGQTQRTLRRCVDGYFQPDSLHMLSEPKKAANGFVRKERSGGKSIQKSLFPLFSPTANICPILHKKRKAGSCHRWEGRACFPQIANPAWSPNSKHLAYMVERSGLWYVAVMASMPRMHSWICFRVDPRFYGSKPPPRLGCKTGKKLERNFLHTRSR
jgi:Tol biopolymer transport system component